ncbi:MAG: CoA transferase [Pseudomonadota bacterium]
MTNSQPAGPLDGVRVLDLTVIMSGPIATMMLADQGADVIKIEPPHGDLLRKLGHRHQGMSGSFLSCNRSKRSLCVDVKTPAGLDIVRKLAATADVLVQNYRPGAIERMGLGEDIIREIRPDIIYVSMSGFGENGPYAHQRVYDPVIQAISGLADVQRDRETGEPRMVRTVVPDKTTAVTAAQAISAALFARERTGRGQHIRLSMFDTMVAYLWPEASSSLSFVGNERDPAFGQLGLDLVFRTRDGHITAGALSDAEWAGMCRAFGREDLINDPRFLTAASRSANIVERRQVMSDEIAKWTRDVILARLDAEGVPSAPVLDRTEVLENAQSINNEIFEIRQDAAAGEIRQPRPAARFSATPASVRSGAPVLGADNAEILGELGFAPDTIRSFEEDAVIHKE